MSEARRWLVLGAGGAGKSTFAVELARILDLPLIHLDQHFWRPGWMEPSKADWSAQVEELSRADSWIMDGNYSGTLETRLARAQIVILLDPPIWQCIHGIFARGASYRGRVRPDLAEGCPERLPNRQFLWYVASYKWRSRPRVLRRIEAAPHVRFHHLRSRAAAREFLDGLRQLGSASAR